MNTTATSRSKAAKSTSTGYTLPISVKAYRSFVERINKVFALDRESGRLMLETLHRYLAGDTSADGTLPVTLRIAFKFLAADIDLAIVRSARARARRTSRQPAANPDSRQPTACKNPTATQTPESQQAAPAHTATSTAHPLKETTSTATDEAHTEGEHRSRRSRRRDERRARVKTRWRKL